jgi:uncharacterized protein (DUF111 family)
MCPPGKEKEIIEILFKETTTLGVRCREKEGLSWKAGRGRKHSLRHRKDKICSGQHGKIIKRCRIRRCRKIAAEKKVPLRVVYEEALLAFRRYKGPGAGARSQNKYTKHIMGPKG